MALDLFNKSCTKACVKFLERKRFFVFTVGTKSVPTEPGHRGRVLGVTQVTNLEVNTQDYAVGAGDLNSVSRFPFALHPLRVWTIDAEENFARFVGPLSSVQHLQAQTTVVELDPPTSEKLLSLPRREVALREPITELGRRRIAYRKTKLAPMHEGAYTASFREHDIWYVYVLALMNPDQKHLAFKIGYSHGPEERAEAYNLPLASAVTGLAWEIIQKEPVVTEQAARDIEQALLSKFSKNRLQNNGEVIAGVSWVSIASAIAGLLRNGNKGI